MPNIQERNVLLEPFFSISINGEVVSEEMLRLVTSVQYEDEQGKAGIAHIVIQDLDRKWMDDARIVKGARISIRMGHRNNHRLMLSGKIKNAEADYPETGVPTFVIVAVDSGASLSGKKRTRSWKNKKISDVIIAIFRENGLGIEIADTKKVLPYIAQSNETDMDFVKRKAKEMDYFFYKTSSGIYYFGATDKYGSANKNLDYRMGGMQIKAFRPAFQEEPDESDSTTDTDINAETGKTTSTKNSTPTSSGPQNYTQYSVDKETGQVAVYNRSGSGRYLQ